MKQAGVNMVSLGIFSWVKVEPREGEYEFGWLDEVMDLLAEAGIDVDLATPTAAPPAWFWKKYPEARPVTRDGVILGGGSRGMVSPSSPEYRRASVAIAEQLARRYARHPALAMWHVHNEYGAPVGESYDDYSVVAFRRWLQERYATIDALNAAWGTAFWGQSYGEWDEIDAPRRSATVSNQAQQLDFHRFTSDALLECFIAERDAIRTYSPDVPITTNFMATNCLTPDYWRWSREVDIVSNDHYLVAERSDNHILLSMDADLTRSLAGGRPWVLMEHSTGAVNWQPRNIAKRAGELTQNSMAHVARGADAVMFFQFRASRVGAEKFHSAMLPHAGTDTRIWKELCTLGEQLNVLGKLAGTRVSARVALLWDTESFWAQDLDWRPSIELNHRERIEAFYTALWNRGVTVNFAHPGHDLSSYDAVIAPSLYLVTPLAAQNLSAYVAGGGSLLVSYFSGIVDENDAVYPGAAPGALRDALGIDIHEFLPFHEGETAVLDSGAVGSVWADDIHLTTARAVTQFSGGPAAGKPAITVNDFGDGRAWYVSTKLDGADLESLVIEVLDGAGVATHEPPIGVETVQRSSDQADFLFVINHGDAPVSIAAEGHELLTDTATGGSVTVPPGEVRVVRHIR
jgi:beta-galactosidase